MMLEAIQIDAEIKAIVDMIDAMREDESAVEPDVELYSRLMSLNMERAGVIAQLGRVFKNYKRTVEALQAEIDFTRDKINKAKASQDAIKNFLFSYMNAGEKYKDPMLSIYWMNQQDKVVIDDMDKVPRELLRVEPKLQEIKTLLKDTKNGIDWARLEQSEEKSLVIR